MQIPRFLYRRDAADYLLTKHGLEVSAEHLARLALLEAVPDFDCWLDGPGEPFTPGLISMSGREHTSGR
jgi:hypothetical protein